MPNGRKKKPEVISCNKCGIVFVRKDFGAHVQKKHTFGLSMWDRTSFELKPNQVVAKPVWDCKPDPHNHSPQLRLKDCGEEEKRVLVAYLLENMEKHVRVPVYYSQLGGIAYKEYFEKHNKNPVLTNEISTHTVTLNGHNDGFRLPEAAFRPKRFKNRAVQTNIDADDMLDLTVRGYSYKVKAAAKSRRISEKMTREFVRKADKADKKRKLTPGELMIRDGQYLP